MNPTIHKHRPILSSLLSFTLLAWSVLPTAAQNTAEAKDPRYIDQGYPIPTKSYCDQPYVVITKDGNWLCVLTTGSGHEGSGGQHFVSTISKDKGKTWGPLVDIEPGTGPEASYGSPLIVPSGRVYAFYTYNGDRISTLPGSDKKIRADMLGWYCFRYSDDNGQSWSKERYRIPMRVTAADRGNQWGGEVQVFWGIDKPKTNNGEVTFAFTKLGKWMLDNGEGWMMHSDNILTETDPEKINWKLLPDGEHGIKSEKFGSVQEEHNHVYIGSDQMYMVYRTTEGFPCHTYSHDGGKSWTEPVRMTYSPDGRGFKNPRACAKLWKCKNGKYLFWYHNHGGKGFPDRNPAWVSGGVLRDGKMHWSEPEIVIYSHDLSYNTGRMSYPDLIEEDGKYWITETQKEIARVHEVDPTLLEGMWAQLEEKGTVTKNGLIMDLQGEAAKVSEVKMPKLPDLSKGGGFTIDLKLTFDDFEERQIILDTREGTDKAGVALGVVKDGSVNLHIADGTNPPQSWNSDPGLLKPGQTHHVTMIVDGGPNIITFVVDGKLCDGGASRQYGWGRFDKKVGEVNASPTLALGPSFRGKIQGLRIYDRYLRTSEAIANYQANINQ